MEILFVALGMVLGVCLLIAGIIDRGKENWHEDTTDEDYYS